MKGLRFCATYFRDSTFPDFASKLGNVGLLKFDVMKDSIPGSYDTCLYLAGSSDHAAAFHDARQDLILNTAGLVNFLQHVDHLESLVLLSSAAVYHGHRCQVSPETPLSPEHPYAISKMATESYVRYFARAGKIDNYLILRLYHAYGPYERPRRIMARLLETFLLKRESQFTVNGDGKTLMDVTHVDELVQVLLNVLVKGGFHNETLDLCSGTPLSLFELAEKTAKAIGMDAKINVNPAVKVDPILFWSKPEANTRFLSRKDRINLTEGVKRYAAWLLSRRPEVSPEGRSGVTSVGQTPPP